MMRRLKFGGVAMVVAACSSSTEPSGPPNVSVDQFAVSGLTYSITVRNSGGDGDYRVVLWGSTIGNFNGQPAVSFEACRRAIASINAGGSSFATLTCAADAYAATAQVRDGASATGWRITGCRAFVGECNPDIQPGRPGAL